MRLLDWDSQFFGKKIAHIDLEKDEDYVGLEEFIGVNNVDLIQAKVEINELEKINFLEQNSFNFADLKINFYTKIDSNKRIDERIVFAEPMDTLKITEIANDMFSHSRYYAALDVFGKDKVSRLYQTWVEKSIKGQFDDYCLICKQNETVCGFITVKELIDQRSAQIGLIGVSDHFRNKGIASTLISAVHYLLHQKGITELKVSTQGKNIGAQNLYIKNGFLVENMQLWYYWKK